MIGPLFIHLNDGWNAYPNGSDSYVTVEGDRLVFEFELNPFIYPDVIEGETALLTFNGCSRWRLGATSDEGWYSGQCRYSGIAPNWGEFYEITGDDPKRLSPIDWHIVGGDAPGGRHFLFYLRDETFECIASDWSFTRKGNSK